MFSEFLIDNGVEYSTNEPMSKHTSFKIGGNAEYYIRPSNEEKLIAVFDKAYEMDMPIFVCGNLSNIVFADEGFNGVVIDTRLLNEIYIDGEYIHAQSGATLTSIARFALEKGLSGLEFSFGIPGTIGGGVYMNAGAYGGCMSDVVAYVRAYDFVNKRILTIIAEKCEFSYRHSVFSDGNMIILSVVLKLTPAEREIIRISMNENMQARRTKQPLDMPSAGSVFKRPEGHYVGAIIDELGLKGLSVGGIKISEKHGGFMVNTGNGTCSDLISLISIVKERVFSAYGITLECEIGFVR